MSRARFAAALFICAVCGSAAALALRGGAEPAYGPDRWTQYQASPSHNAAFPGTLRTSWLTTLGGRINGGLALVRGTLYADSFDRKLYAIDPQSGAVRWSAAASNILMSTPIVSDGLVIVGSGKDGFLKPDDASSQVWGRDEGDEVIAFTTDGRRAWSVNTVGQDMPSAAADRSNVYFVNGDAHAYARDLRSGSPKWTTPVDGIATMASATLSGDTVYSSICHNAPYRCATIALDKNTGGIKWSNPIGGSDCTPTIAGARVFVQSSSIDVAPYHTGGRVTVAALDARTGRTLWHKTYAPAPYTYIASSERQIAGTAVGGVLYAPISNLARVVALDQRTGREHWTVHTSGNVKMSPVLANGKLYFGDTAGIFYSVDARSGRVLHTGSYLQPFSVSPPVIYGRTLFVADGNMVLAIPLDWLQ